MWKLERLPTRYCEAGYGPGGAVTAPKENEGYAVKLKCINHWKSKWNQHDDNIRIANSFIYSLLYIKGPTVQNYELFFSLIQNA